MRWWWTGLATTWLACARPAAPEVVPEAPAAFVPTPACDWPAFTECGADALPRLDHRLWSSAQFAALRERARFGSVAVKMGAEGTELVSGCRLDGAYAEFAGEPGSGRFWASNRALFLPDEVDASCAGATHSVAAFAVRGETFSAVLVPLPCPSVHDPLPATRCVGLGMNGSQRVERAEARVQRFGLDASSSPAAPELRLEVYALAPDGRVGIEHLREGRECGLSAQIEWVRDGFRWSTDRFLPGGRDRVAPSFDEIRAVREGRQQCHHSPVFLKCFPDLFEPRRMTDYPCFLQIAEPR